MKILLTGGGSGGHFYPLVAIAERINLLARQRKILKVDVYYMSDSPYDEKSLKDNNISFVHVSTGKLRLYPSIKNFTDMFKVAIGIIEATFKMFFIYPDVVIAKGGHGSFPALVAARLLRIPVMIHESDTHPGRVNLWAGKFAQNILVAFKETEKYFDKTKTVVIGLPIRNEIMHLPSPDDGAKYYSLDTHTPTIFIYAGSLGAEKINNLILESLPELLKKYQIIHQCGKNNLEEVKLRSSIILENHLNKHNYIIKPFLDAIETRHAAATASLVVARAGSTLFEIATWQIPSIIIPITHSHGDHQRKNAISFAETGGGIVIEESNALPHLFISKVDEILLHEDIWQKMSKANIENNKVDAAYEIAHAAILIGEAHDLE
jgi:UDP-N-acetylglucosamine--N-acetylmuramyl-(pentapeptide) pyrophosphoryl-undecaprenol N-acetylglucosamine transferase